MFLDDIKQMCLCHPNRIVRSSENATLTFSQLWHHACALAALIGTGSSPVVLYGNKQPDIISAMLACLLCQRAYIPFDANMPHARLLQYIGQAKAGLCIAFAPVGTLPVECLHQKNLNTIFQNQTLFSPKAAYDMHKTAYIIFTSGTTGSPKGIPVTFENLNHFLCWATHLPTLQRMAGKTIYSTASYSFDLSVLPLYLALTAGNTLVEAPPNAAGNLPELFSSIQKSQCALLVCTPTFLQLCVQEGSFSQQALPQLSCIFSCGEVFPVALAKLLLARFPGIQLLNAYGPTEATCAVSAIAIEPAHLQSPELPIGLVAHAAADIFIADEQIRPLPDNALGEIILCGKSVAHGYLANSTQEQFFRREGQNAYRTGDLGRIRNGVLYFAGRRDNQIKYKAYRIEPEEIEAHISHFLGGAPCVVSPVFRRQRVAWLTALVQAPQRHTTGEIAEYLRNHLPGYMVPKFIRYTEKIPVTNAGKLDRAKAGEQLQNEN